MRSLSLSFSSPKILTQLRRTASSPRPTSVVRALKLGFLPPLLGRPRRQRHKEAQHGGLGLDSERARRTRRRRRRRWWPRPRRLRGQTSRLIRLIGPKAARRPPAAQDSFVRSSQAAPPFFPAVAAFFPPDSLPGSFQAGSFLPCAGLDPHHSSYRCRRSNLAGKDLLNKKMP